MVTARAWELVAIDIHGKKCQNISISIGLTVKYEFGISYSPLFMHMVNVATVLTNLNLST